MANTKHILEGVKIEGEVCDLIAKSDGENVKVTYNGKSTTLAAALAEIFTGVSELPTSEDVTATVKEEIAKLVDGAPESFDTLKEIADYIAEDKTAASALVEVIGGKVDKVDGKGLSTEDFTTEFKGVLEQITAEKIAEWDAKADAVNATTSKAGLMSAADKAKLDGLNGVRVGSEIPEDLKNGELFIRVVTD